MALRLLKLPRLALNEIVSSMDFQVILLLTQLSQRMRRILLTMTSKPIRLTVIDRESCEFNIMSSTVTKIQIQSFQQNYGHIWHLAENVPVPTTYLNGELITYWEKTEDAIRELFEFLRTIARITEISFSGEHRYSPRAYDFVDRVANSPLELDYFFSSVSPRINARHLCQLVRVPRLTLMMSPMRNRDLNRFLKYFMVNPGNVLNWWINSDDERFDEERVMNGIEAVLSGYGWEIFPANGRRFIIEMNEEQFRLNCPQ